MNYYNENDSFAASWLRNLIAAKLIPNGFVDERSILDVKPHDLANYTQCHFFAGIGGWSRALQIASWPVDRAVWTGSCPCQPFSAAGQGVGFADERHLWPAWFHLIEQCAPEQIFGEQVASKAGLEWFDLVRTDLESAAYSVACADLCAAGVGAPHIRQRLWFVADAGYLCGRTGVAATHRATHIGGQENPSQTERCGINGELGDAEGDEQWQLRLAETRERRTSETGRSGAWSDLEWLPCTDGKARPVELGTFPLAYGIPGRVGRLRAYGNAIVPQVAAEFIAAYMNCK